MEKKKRGNYMIRRRNHTIMIFLLAFTVFLLAGCSVNQDSSNDKSQASGSSSTSTLMGDFSGVTIEGDAVDQTIFAQSQLTMINVWATFCSPCIRELPDLGQISREYETSQFQVIGIISDVSEANDDTAVNLIEETKADYTHLVGTSDLYDCLLDRVQAVPTTFFVDKDGVQVGDSYTGSKSQSEWETVIKEKLEEVQGN